MTVSLVTSHQEAIPSAIHDSGQEVEITLPQRINFIHHEEFNVFSSHQLQM